MRCLAKRPADRWQTAAELHAALEPLGTPSSGITPTHTQPVPPVGSRRRLPWIAAAVVMVALGAIAAWRLTSGHGNSTTARTVAVLPFENASRDTAFDYLADGIANDVRSGLMKVPGLSVKARTSSEAAKGKPLRDVGTMLNVGVVLQGTFRHGTDKTTVTVDLVKVADETALWTGSYTLPADGNFAAAQDSITAAVARALHLQPSSGVTSALAQRGTKDVDAYDLYLKGQHFFATRGAANLRRAIDYFQRAISRDSNFARAYAGLSMAQAVLPAYAQVTDDALSRASARAARRALAIDPELVDGHLALADVILNQGRPADAETEFMAALARDPRNVTAHQWHGDNLTFLGRMDDAIREGRIAVDLDPLSAVAANDLAYSLIAAGRYDEAIQVAHTGLEVDSTFGYANEYLGVAFAFAQEPDSAQVMFERLFRIDSTAPTARAYHVWEFALAGRWTAAERELTAVERTITGGSRDVDLAIANMALGNKAAALDALERAARAHSYYASNTALGCDPTFGPLRSEPRFLAVLKQLGQGLCTSTAKWPIPARTTH